MDQDAFRNLLASDKPAPGQTPASRSSLLDGKKKQGSSKGKTIPASEPAFKPRKVKKASESYRDRAEERRAGKEGDYAPVEAILEEFEKRNADNEDRAAVDEQRRYLGGDSDHSILVKGLDFALLEQNRARLASTTSKQDDEELEEVFAQTTSAPSDPSSKKRTRADIIKELKEKRADVGVSEQSTRETTTEGRPDQSKFRPIGFKPIGASTKDKSKKERSRDGGEPKKKKRKVKPAATDQKGNGTSLPTPQDQIASTSGPRKLSPQPEAEAEDFDIFADAGEYKGVDLESDDSDDEEPEQSSHKSPPEPQAGNSIEPQRRGWFDDGAEPVPEKAPAPAPAEQPTPGTVEAEAEEEQAGRLAPLNTSAIPSIREFLEMDDAVEKEEKRRARKEKRKGKSKGG